MIMYNCEKLFGKKVIGAYYEFNFAMALAAECGRRGDCLDMRSMRIFDKELLSDGDIAYMRYLQGLGYIYDGQTEKKMDRGSDKEISIREKNGFFNTQLIDDLGIRVIESREAEDGMTMYYWCSEYAYKTYGKYVQTELNRKRLSNTSLHILAYLYISIFNGEIEKKPIHFFYKSLETCNIYLYQSLLACEKSIPGLRGLIHIDLDEDYVENIGDMDFNLIVSIASHSGRMRKWSCSEKIEAFEKYGLKKGSICILYERGRVSESNVVGVITGACVVRVDDYFDGINKDITESGRYKRKGRAGWLLTKFSVNKTKEEMLDDYYGIDEEYKGMFTDLLHPSLGSTQTFMSFENVGVGTYFLDEEYILMPIERECKNKKKVTIDGKSAVVDLDDVESIYWILSQFGVDFDKEEFKRYYNGGNELTYDMFDCRTIDTRRGDGVEV